LSAVSIIIQKYESKKIFRVFESAVVMLELHYIEVTGIFSDIQCWVVTRYKSNTLLFGVTSPVMRYYLPEVT